LSDYHNETSIQVKFYHSWQDFNYKIDFLGDVEEARDGLEPFFLT